MKSSLAAEKFKSGSFKSASNAPGSPAAKISNISACSEAKTSNEVWKAKSVTASPDLSINTTCGSEPEEKDVILKIQWC